MVTAIKAIIMANEKLGVGTAHSVKDITAVATPIYAVDHPDGKTPEATIAATIYRFALDRGITEKVENGLYLVHPEKYNTHNPQEEQTLDEESVEFEKEADVTALLATKGYVVIEDMRGNPQYGNPDAYQIINGRIISVEAKNTIALRSYMAAVGEAATNGAWAHASVLVYVNGPDDEIKNLAIALGIGVRKVVGSEVIEIVTPTFKNIQADLAKQFTNNQGIVNAFVEFAVAKNN